MGDIWGAKTARICARGRAYRPTQGVDMYAPSCQDGWSRRQALRGKLLTRVLRSACGISSSACPVSDTTSVGCRKHYFWLRSDYSRPGPAVDLCGPGAVSSARAQPRNPRVAGVDRRACSPMGGPAVLRGCVWRCPSPSAGDSNQADLARSRRVEPVLKVCGRDEH